MGNAGSLVPIPLYFAQENKILPTRDIIQFRIVNVLMGKKRIDFEKQGVINEKDSSLYRPAGKIKGPDNTPQDTVP